MANFRDLYIVRWLLQKTGELSGNIIWQRKEYGRYFADFNEGKNRVRIEVGTAIRPPRVYIKLTSLGLGEVQVQEPLQALFSRKYESQEDEELAQVVKRLLATISSKHSERQLKDIENEEERKQAIYYRLLGGKSD